MRISIRIVAAGLVLASACAPSLDKLVRHLNAGEHKSAVVRVTGDPRMENELAALILEQRALAGAETAGLVSVLASAGRPGKRALERLANRKIEPAAGLAEVALRRGAAPDGKTVSRLLGAKSSEVRSAAAIAWSAFLEYDVLEEMALDPAPKVRRAAVAQLGRFGGERRASNLLREALRKDPDPKVRAAAARQGPLLGPDGFHLLKSALKDQNLGVALAAIQGLAALGATEATALLEDLAVGPLDVVAVVAATELCRLGSETGRSRFEHALRSPEPRIRAAALLRLERAGLKEQERILVEALEDKAPRVVLLAAYSLARKPELAAEVRAALERVEAESAHSSEEARDLLAAMGDTDALSKVRAVFEKGEPAQVVRTLGRTARAVELRSDFVQLMADPRWEVRVAAAQAVLAAARD